MKFGDMLREYRLSRGATQQEFAERLGVTQPSYSGFENAGDVKLSTILRICTLLGVSPGTLLQFKKESEK